MKNNNDTDEHTLSEVESTMQMLCRLRIPHVVKQCSSSTSIKIDTGRSYFYPNSGEKIDSKYLKFITETKNEVCANAIEKNFQEVNPKFIKFSYLFKDCFEHGYKEFYEIDINAAYWFCAYDFGLITKSTYEQGLTVPKKVRLMALGAAAATKDVLTFDGLSEGYKHQGIEYDPAGRLAFFNIANRVDEVMQIVLSDFPGQAAFYWVDAVFVRAEFAEYVRHYIADFGFETKAMPLAWIKGDATRKVIETMKITEETDFFCECERKIYFKPKKGGKKYLKKPAKKLTLSHKI